MLQSQNKKFQRRREDFQCENCGTLMTGDGYTNHCTKCLWSKHVDIAPGDRAARCGGLMEPIRLEQRGKDSILTHRCKNCAYEKKNKVAAGDDFEALLQLSHCLAEK